jgi:hypothetical protein
MSIYHNSDDSFLAEMREWFINNPISNEELKAECDGIIVPWNKGKVGYQTVSEETKKLWKKQRVGKGNSMYGKHHSAETKQRISESKQGHLPWNTGKVWNDDIRYKIGKDRRKAVSCEGVIYDSPRTAAKALSITRYGVMYRIKSRSDYFYI